LITDFTVAPTMDDKSGESGIHDDCNRIGMDEIVGDGV
jgi:hypothetical protein